MSDATTLRVAAVFAFLSPLAIFAGIPFAAGLGGVGGPGPIDFGDGVVLARLAELGAAPARVDLFALLGPIFALPATMGWYVLLRSEGRLAQLGVVLWYVGMIFVIAQDALQLALVSTLPASYAAADPATRAAIEAVGGGLGYSIEVLAFSGHFPLSFGIILLSLLMWRCAAIPKWLAARLSGGDARVQLGGPWIRAPGGALARHRRADRYFHDPRMGHRARRHHAARGQARRRDSECRPRMMSTTT